MNQNFDKLFYPNKYKNKKLKKRIGINYFANNPVNNSSNSCACNHTQTLVKNLVKNQVPNWSMPINTAKHPQYNSQLMRQKQHIYKALQLGDISIDGMEFDGLGDLDGFFSKITKKLKDFSKKAMPFIAPALAASIKHPALSASVIGMAVGGPVASKLLSTASSLLQKPSVVDDLMLTDFAPENTKNLPAIQQPKASFFDKVGGWVNNAKNIYDKYKPIYKEAREVYKGVKDLIKDKDSAINLELANQGININNERGANAIAVELTSQYQDQASRKNISDNIQFITSGQAGLNLNKRLQGGMGNAQADTRVNVETWEDKLIKYTTEVLPAVVGSATQIMQMVRSAGANEKCHQINLDRAREYFRANPNSTIVPPLINCGDVRAPGIDVGSNMVLIGGMFACGLVLASVLKR